MSVSYNDHVVLFVDDEEKTRKYFSRLFGDKFKILLAEDGQQALGVFRQNMDDIALVVTDQRMPNMTGSQLLEKVAELKPSCIKILSTAYSDIDAAIDAVNKGGMYQYITKPWEVNDLEVVMMRAVELYSVQKERDSLLRQKLSSVEMLASSDRVLSIATLAVFRHEGLRHVGEALKILVELAETGAGDTEDDTGVDPDLNWRELYRRHLIFLRAIREGLTDDKLHGETLDYSQTVPVMDAVGPLTDELGCFQWIGEETSNTEWPGSKDAIQAEVKPLLSALADVMRDAGIILISEAQGGVEIKLSSRLLAKNLEPFRKATKEAPSDACIALAGAFFRLAHAGAIFEVLPESRRDMIRLKVLFDLQKRVDTGEIGWDSLVGSLAGNDVFWSRYGA
ncbi:MAG: response regulator [Verrucomicrobiae bacterium]|nr:response regulator [Verrucomicrobiae bacterium]NNJ86766.1 response regulator [Akkermansiaceae bacterium]